MVVYYNPQDVLRAQCGGSASLAALDRARSPPLHLQFEHGSKELQRLVVKYHKNIGSLRWIGASMQIFEDRSFPNLGSLYMIMWRKGSLKLGAMERLEHLNLHLSSRSPDFFDLKQVPPLMSISTRSSFPYRLLRHSQPTLTSINIPDTLNLPNLASLSWCF